MTTKARDIIQDALEMLNVYAPGETVDAASMNRGLVVLNDMLDSWSNESLACYTILEQSLTLIPGQSVYTIGPGGDVNGTRPIRLITGPGAAYIQDTNKNNYGVNVVALDQWNLIGSREVNSNVPDTLYYEPSFPLGKLKFFPTPNIGWEAIWDSYLQLGEFPSLDTDVSLPPGYNLALKSNLAVSLQPYFNSAQLSTVVAKNAMDSKGNVKRANIRPNVAVYDPEIISRATPTYNIYTDRGGAAAV